MNDKTHSRREFLGRVATVSTVFSLPAAIPADILANPTPAAPSDIAKLASLHLVSAAEWATLRGRLVYDGTPPVPKKIVVDKDIEVCGQQDLIDETLLVNPQNKGIRNIVVQLDVGRGEKLEIHESYAADAEGEVLLDNKYCRWKPHVLAMRTTQTLLVRNEDPIGDNVKIDPLKNTAINVNLSPNGGLHRQRFPAVERVPARITCAIHPWELGWLVITDHPYVAISDEEGNFEVLNVPVGARSFRFWHEKAGYVAQVTRDGKTEEWRRGVQQFDLQSGVNDLGEILISPALFKD